MYLSSCSTPSFSSSANLDIPTGPFDLVCRDGIFLTPATCCATKRIRDSIIVASTAYCDMCSAVESESSLSRQTNRKRLLAARLVDLLL